MARKAAEREIFNSYYSLEAFEDARDFLFEEYRKPEWKTKEDVPDDEVFIQLGVDIDISWNNEKERLDDFFSCKTFVAVGLVSHWDGTCEEGKLIHSVDDLTDMFSDCESIRLYDVNGHFMVHGSHCDGTMDAELKELTEEGRGYAFNYRCLDDRLLHKRLFNSSRYSRLPHYAHLVYGRPKVQYEPSVSDAPDVLFA